MRGFARRVPVAEVWAWLDAQTPRLEAEAVPLLEAAGRVLSQEIVSLCNVPPFTRAMMDGYAVRSADTLGASAYNPIRLQMVGRSGPGQPFAHPIGPQEAVQIMTGAPMPPGADAVLPAEMAELEDSGVVVLGEVSPGRHVGQIAEDIAEGSPVLPAGRLLRPQDVGVLASLGLAEVPVVRQPRVRILVTGDELLPAGASRQPHCIYDSNGPMLLALVRRDGGVPEFCGIVPDRPEAILRCLRAPVGQAGLFPGATLPGGEEGTARSSGQEPRARSVRSGAGSGVEGGSRGLLPDVILISGGSSVGQEDHAPRVLAEHGQLVFHGMAMRPSSPAGIGLWEGRLVFLLPGNPVSCLCAYDFFAGRAIRLLGGQSGDWPYRRMMAPLARKVSSMIGRLDYLRVRLVDARAEPIGISGAGILTTTTQADGFVVIPPESEGYPAGTPVEVFLY